MLHNFGSTGRRLEFATDLDAWASSSGNYIAYPDGTTGSWNAGACCGQGRDTHVDDVAVIDSIIQSLATSYGIAPAKIVVGGYSNGAMMALRYACVGTSTATGVVSNVGIAFPGDCISSKPTHVLAINGLKDTSILWNSPQTSPLINQPEPAAKDAMDVFEGVDGCGPGWSSASDPSTGNVHNSAVGCRQGASIDQYVVPLLTHTWTTKDTDIPSLGINVTKAVGDWLNNQWAATTP
jgi:polyhydroxybutyrate depolymerase